MITENGTITLAHGSGGSLSNQLLEQGIFKILDNKILNRRHDGAIIDLGIALAFTTDTFVVSPLFFPGGNIGDLAVNGTVNDLAMCGAVAKYLSLSFIIEEGLPKDELFSIISSIKLAAENAGVAIVTGDTKIVEKGKGDRIFINTSGIGICHPKASIDPMNIKPDDKIIISGSIANHGMAILSLREGLEFESGIKSDTKPLNHTIIKLLDAFAGKIHCLRDPTRGGVASVLNEIARQTGFGMAIGELSLCIHEEVSALCEMLGIDPLYVANEGIFIAWVEGTAADDIIMMLNEVEPSSKATVLGKVTSEHPGQVVMKCNTGGKRVVSMPVGEQLPRIC